MGRAPIIKANVGIKIFGEKIFEKLETISSKKPETPSTSAKIVIKATMISTSSVSHALKVIQKLFKIAEKPKPLKIASKIAEIKIETPIFSFIKIRMPSNKITDKRIKKSIIRKILYPF
jgi:hypothetical protein